MLDVPRRMLTQEDEEHLRHPLTCGVNLLTRTYESHGQFADLTTAIHALHTPTLLIAADHQSDRVQY